MRHAPNILDRCRRPWCTKRRAPLSLPGLCAEHARLAWSSPEARKLIDQLAKRPVSVPLSLRR